MRSPNSMEVIRINYSNLNNCPKQLKVPICDESMLLEQRNLGEWQETWLTIKRKITSIQQRQYQKLKIEDKMFKKNII